MRVLVTGATGFVGSNLAAALAARGDTVRVLRRETSRLDALEGIPVEHAIGDVLEPEAVRAALEGCELLFHVAAISQYWRTSKDAILRVNVEGTRIVMQAALEAGVNRVVHTSSIAALGIPEPGRVLDESHPFPDSSQWWTYGYSKHLAELEVQEAVRKGLSAVMVNPAVIVGPRDVNFVGGELIRASLKGQLRIVPPGGTSTIHVDDVVFGHLAAAEKGVAGERYILGSENLSHREIAAILAEVTGGAPPLLTLPGGCMGPLGKVVDAFNGLHGGVPLVTGEQLRLGRERFYTDNAKAVRVLGLPQGRFRQAAQDAFDWYRERGMI